MEIRPLTPKDCMQVARLHISCLQTQFSGRAGEQLLCRYYQTICLDRGAVSYIGFLNGKMAGFVCGVWEPFVLRTALLVTHLPSLLVWGALQALVHPAIVAKLFESLGHSRKSGARKTQVQSDYELRPIVVVPQARGSGMAYQLTMRLLNDARSRGFAIVHLYTELENMVARRFYEKVGFRETGLEMRNGRVYLRFECQINNK